MAKENKKNQNELLADLKVFIRSFETIIDGEDLRSKVLALIPVVSLLHHIGSSLITDSEAGSARDRILLYFKKYPQKVLAGNELFIVSGIHEWARRVRELRVQFGWKIATGLSIKEMIREGEIETVSYDQNLSMMKPDEYILLNSEQDKAAAHRWNIANSIRKKKISVRDKILEYLRTNVNEPISGEELRYVAGNHTEWARRVRELRTDFGWPVVTKMTGRPSLGVGEYLLEADHQNHPHDRHIPDPIRREVLRRDKYSCTNPDCQWSINDWNKADPRFLELHHKIYHSHGGDNTPENLQTLCNVCHDEIHKNKPEI